MFFKGIVKCRFGPKPDRFANGFNSELFEFIIQQPSLRQNNSFLVDVVVEIGAGFGIYELGNGIAIGTQLFGHFF